MGGREQLSTRDLAGGSDTPAGDRDTRDEERFTPDERTADRTPDDTGEHTADRTPDDMGERPAAERDVDASSDTVAEPAEPAEPVQREEERAPAVSATGNGAPASTGAIAGEPDEGHELLPADEDATFQRRWEEIQTGFVDEPRRAVEQADELVAQVMQRLAEGFAAERESLEQQWGRGEDISTEDLRVALQRYRAFFQRLLSA